MEEAWRNLAIDRPEAVTRLERLCKAIITVNAPQGLKLLANVQLDDKDQPILLAPIHGRADYLLTGDAGTSRTSTESALRPYSCRDRDSISHVAVPHLSFSRNPACWWFQHDTGHYRVSSDRLGMVALKLGGLPYKVCNDVAYRRWGRGLSTRNPARGARATWSGVLEAAQTDDPCLKPPKLLDATQQATIVALVCGPPSPGRARWTIVPTAQEAQRRGVGHQVGRETIRRPFVSHELKPWR